MYLLFRDGMIIALEYKIPQLQVFYDHGDTGLCMTKKSMLISIKHDLNVFRYMF